MVNSSEDKKTGFSIKLKFILGIAILVVLIVGLNSYNSSQRESALLQESMDQSGKLLSSTLAIACQDPIISQSYDAFIPYTERIIAGGQDIQEISILDIDGRYLAHKVRDDSESKLGQVEDGICTGECDISTTNYEGESTHASGRIWFPHWYTRYSGTSTPPFSFTVSAGGKKIVEGETMDLGFAVEVPGYCEVTVCIEGPCIVLPAS